MESELISVRKDRDYWRELCQAGLRPVPETIPESGQGIPKPVGRRTFRSIQATMERYDREQYQKNLAQQAKTES